MGTYATHTSLAILMVGTTFDTATTALASKLITHAEDEVNKHLSKRYDVTSFSTVVPPLVTTLTETLSEGYMYIRMSRGGKEGLKRGQDIVAMATKNLQDIVDYKLNLVNTAGSLIADSENTSYRVLCNTSEYTPTFGEDDPLNWKVDEDKLNDLDDERDS